MKKTKLARLIPFILSLSLLFTACSGGGSSSGSNSETITLRVGIEATFTPFSFINENDELTGFEVELLRLAADKMPGIEIVFEQMAFDSLAVALEAGQLDVISHQMAKNDEREEKFTFPSQSYINSSNYITVKGDVNGIESLSDLAGQTVSVFAASLGARLLQEYNDANPDNQINVSYADIDSSILVAEGKAFATLAIPGEVYQYQKEGLDIKVTGDPVTEVPVWHIFRAGDDLAEVIEAYDAAIRELREDGTIAALSVEWLGVDLT